MHLWLFFLSPLPCSLQELLALPSGTFFSVSIAATPSHHLCSFGYCNVPSSVGFLPSFLSSLNLPGAQWPERSFKNIIWMVSILLWFPCPLRIKSRLPGPQDFVLAFFSSTITHESPSPTEHGSLFPFQGSNP